MPRPVRILIAVQAVALVACVTSRDGTSENASYQVRDSAGIQVAVSSAPRHDTLPWVLTAEPTFSVGSAVGADVTLLHRVTDARLLDSGRVLVSHSSTSRLRIYQPDGSLSGSLGRAGSGPGDVGNGSTMRILRLTADSVTVTDEVNSRVVTFSLGGGTGTILSPGRVNGFALPGIRGRFANGDWLVRRLVGPAAYPDDLEFGTVIRMEYALFRYDSAMGGGTRLATAPARPRVFSELGNGDGHYPFVPLTQDPVFAVRGNELLLAVEGESAIRVIDSSGTVTQVMRWRMPRTAVAGIWKRYGDSLIVGLQGDWLAGYQRLVADPAVPVPDSVPAVQSLLVDDQGRIWAERFRLPWEQSATWDLLSTEGEWLGAMTMPARFTVFAVTGREVVGRQLDEDGVESVVVYRLRLR